MAFWVSAGARTHGLRRLGPASPASRLPALLGLDGAGALSSPTCPVPTRSDLAPDLLVHHMTLKKCVPVLFSCNSVKEFTILPSQRHKPFIYC